MGLDMFAYKTKEKINKEVDFDRNEPEVEPEELHYWRKHPNLHGWMEQLYREKGGEDEAFNCVGVVLNGEDLNKLEAAINERELPETEGFFFGKSFMDDNEVKDDLQFVADARNAIEEGYTVYYTSWW